MNSTRENPPILTCIVIAFFSMETSVENAVVALVLTEGRCS